MEDIPSVIDYEFDETSSTPYDSFWDHSSIKTFRILLHVAISLIGIIGSVITCIIVFFRQQRGKSTPVFTFIGTVAMGDILYGLVSSVVCPAYIIYGAWIFGEIFCFLAYFVDEFNQQYSIIVIAAGTCWTLCNANNLKFAIAINFIIAMSMMLLSLLSTLFSWSYVTHNDHHYCHAHPHDGISKKLQKLLQIFINFVLPILVIAANCVIKNGNTSSIRLLMVVMVAVYLLLESPSILIIFAFNKLSYGNWVVFGLISQTKLVYKTVVCYVMDRSFREEFLEIISLCLRKRRDQEGYHLQQNV